MFNSRNLLVGLVIASALFGVGSDRMTVFAQNQQSDGYLSDEEIDSIRPSKFQGRQLQTYQDKRSRYELDQITKFSNDWGVIDPNIAPFLGQWVGYERVMLSVYPSNVKGRSCIVYSVGDDVRDSSGIRTFYIHTFGTGKISGNKLLVETEQGRKFVIVKQSTATNNGRINILATLYRTSGENNFSAFAFPRLLEPFRPEKLQQFGCTTLAPQDLSGNSNRSISSNTTDTQKGYLSNSEVQNIRQNFQNLIEDDIQKSGDMRSSTQLSSLINFNNAWEKANPSIAPFLGEWLGYESSLAIYPSNTKNKVCLIGNGVGGGFGKKTYGIGIVSGNQILTSGEIGERILIINRGKLRKYGTGELRRSPVVPYDADILLSLLTQNGKIISGRQSFAHPYPLPQNDTILTQLGCSSALPSISGNSNSSTSTTPVKPTDTIAKYPTNEDFNAFEDKLQGNPESLVKLRGNQAEQRRKFQNEWKARNPNAAKFLGAWYTGDRYFYVFPATVKGGTCVVTQDANGKLNMQVGTVLNKELRYGGGKGFFWRDRENIVASRDSGSGSLYPIYATSGMPELPESMIGDMERQKCVTTLPVEVDAQYYKERGDKFAKLGKKDEAISNYRKAIELLRKQNQFAQAKAIEAQIVKLGGSVK